MMRFHNITHDDMLNGPGLRTVLWVAGCEHHCPGCQNLCTWNPDEGLLFDEDAETELFSTIHDWTSGITFSGGDPLHPANRKEIGRLARKFRELYPDKDIWIYTGYQYKYDESDRKVYFENELTKETFTIPWIDQVDVIIDGRFKEDVRKKDIKEKISVLWKGSSNQKTVDNKSTLKEHKLILY